MSLQKKTRRTVERDPTLLAGLAHTAWWKMLLRGLVALAFGGLALLSPKLGERLIFTWLGAFMLVDGALSIAAVFNHLGKHGRCGWMLSRGIVNLLFGLFMVVRPEMSARIIFYVLGVWAVIGGVCELNFGLWMRQFGAAELALVGAVSIVVGMALIIAPSVAALSATLLLGIYAAAVGLLLVVVSLRLRALT